MCCSIRAAVFFMASNHIFFSITQMCYVLPVAVGGVGDKVLENLMAFLFSILFFATGFMTFRAADEESATLVRLGAICLSIVLIFRFLLISLSLMLVETIPEASFLYVYETPFIPIVFTVILYLIYLAILFCYYKELKHESANRTVASPELNFRSHRSHPRRQMPSSNTHSSTILSS